MNCNAGRRDHGHEQNIHYSVSKLNPMSLEPGILILIGGHSGWVKRLQLPFILGKNQFFWEI